MSQPIAFTPMGATQSVSVSASSQPITLPNLSNQVRVYNAGTAAAFVNPYGSVASLATSMPIPAGAVEVFTIGPGTVIGVIAAGSTGSVYFTGGEGL